MDRKDEMTIDERRKYLRKMKKCCARDHRKAHGQLFDWAGVLCKASHLRYNSKG